jgi:IclR family transcriptional regulator, pca regulon regulatory protein
VPSDDREFVRSLARGLSVMVALGSQRRRTLAELAQATGLSRAVVRRLLITLDRLGYVEQFEGRFLLTPRVLRLGHAFLSSLELPQIVLPHLERLVSIVNEPSSAAILDGGDIVYVARVAAPRLVTEAISVGTRLPATDTAMGRVLLASLPPDALAPALDALPARADRERVLAQLERVRRSGWAIVDGELEPGLRSVAAPIHGPGQTPVAAINLSTVDPSLTVTRMRRRLLPQLLDSAGAIERDRAIASR